MTINGAAAKQRLQQGLVHKNNVFVHTGPFRPEPNYSCNALVPLRRPTADSALLVRAALLGLRAITVLASSTLGPRSCCSTLMDLETEPALRGGQMAIRDKLNDRYGRLPIQAGRKLYMLQYRTSDGERRKLALGLYRELTVEQGQLAGQEMADRGAPGRRSPVRPRPLHDLGAWTQEEEAQGSAEERIVARLLRSRERYPKLAKHKKDSMFKETRKLACKGCGTDAVEKYGAAGNGVVYAHHTKQLRKLSGPTETKLKDLALLCPTCHRIVHATQLKVSALLVFRARALAGSPCAGTHSYIPSASEGRAIFVVTVRGQDGNG